MPNLYYNDNSSTNPGVWEDVQNWWEDDSYTIQASNVPWQDGVDTTYLGYDLYGSSSWSHTYGLAINITISSSATGLCYIDAIVNSTGAIYGGNFNGYGFINNSFIYAGNFSGSGFVNSSGYIYGGNFSGSGFVNSSSYIYGGNFSGPYFYNSSSTIAGGAFSGSNFVNAGYISGGTFSVMGFDNTSGTVNYAIILGTNNIGGTVSQYVIFTNDLTKHWFWHYYSSNNWNDASNWFSDIDATQPTNSVPWVSDDATKNYDLHQCGADFQGQITLNIDTDIGNGFSIPSTCDIGSHDGGSFILYNFYGGSVYSGTFSGTNFNNFVGNIYDGTFTGDGFYNYVGYVYGGTFSGSSLSNQYGVIYGGTFSGNGFLNNFWGNIYGGLFSGNYLSNVGYILGGTFSGTGFDNTSGTVNYALILGTNNIGGTVSQYVIFTNDLTKHWFWHNSNSNHSWNDANNWFSDIDATQPTNSVPWVSDDATKNYDLHQCGADFQGQITLNIDTDIGNGFSIPSTCDIGAHNGSGSILINSSGIINGGTFTGDQFDNEQDVYNGIFSGANFLNNSTGNIFDGVFNGDSMTNYGIIYNGTFTGNGFYNYGYIFGGSIGGSGFVNNEYVYNGNFTGQFYVNYGVIYNGIFSGVYFSNQNATLGGLFSGDNFTNSGYLLNGYFSGEYFINSGDIYNGIFVGREFINSSTIHGGTFSGSGFNNFSVVLGGMFVRSGTLSAEGGLRIKGQFTLVGGDINFNSNQEPLLVDWQGDILGAGLL